MKHHASHGGHGRRLPVPILLGVLTALLVAGPALAQKNRGTQNEMLVRKIDRIQTVGDGSELAHPIGVRVDGEGFVWLADTGNGRVLKLNQQGALLMSVGKRGSGPGELMLPTDMTVDRQGYIYVADTMNHRISKYGPDGAFVKSWGELGSVNGPHGIDVGPDGNLYVADTLAHRILKFNRDGKLLKTWGREGRRRGELRFPHGIDVTSDGSVYVSDFLNHRVVKFSSDGAFLDSWGELGSEPGQFHHPWGLDVDPFGNIWVMDMSNNRLQRIAPDGTVAVHDNFADQAVEAGRQTGGYTTLEEEAWDDGDYANSKDVAVAAAVTTVEPTTDSARAASRKSESELVRLFVGHSGKFSLDIMEADPRRTRTVREPRRLLGEARVAAKPLDLTVAHRITRLEGPAPTAGRKGRAREALRPREAVDPGELRYPIAARGGPSELTYVADTGNHRVVVVNASGKVVRTFGSYGSGRGQLDLPSDLVVDEKGNAWVADTMNDRVQVFSPRGEVLKVFGNDRETRAPHGIALGHDGTVYVADTLNHRIARYDRDGKLVGHFGSYGSGAGELAFPHGLAVNGKYLYIADFMNHRIVKTTLAGKQVDEWGEFGAEPGQFRHPWGVAVGLDDDVWVGDMTNSRIQRFSPSGNLVGIFGSHGKGLGQFDHPKGVDIRRSTGELVVGIPGLHAVDLIRGDVGRVSDRSAASPGDASPAGER